MSTVTRPRLYRWTREEYDAMIETGIFREKNIELIEGEIVEMTPIGPPHSAAVTIAADLLRDVFGREYFIRIHMPFVASSRSKPQPDIAVIHGSARDFVARDPRGGGHARGVRSFVQGWRLRQGRRPRILAPESTRADARSVPASERGSGRALRLSLRGHPDRAGRRDRLAPGGTARADRRHGSPAVNARRRTMHRAPVVARAGLAPIVAARAGI